MLKKRAADLGMTLTEYIHRAIKAFAPRARHLVWLAAAILFCLSMAPWLLAQETPRHHRLWIASVGALVAGNALDIASSRGGVELNPALRSANGQFNTGKAFAIKGGATAALVLVEWLLIRKHRNIDKQIAVINFGVAAIPAGMAIRNWRMK